MNQAITFFYKPNSLRKSELAFFKALQNHYPNSQTRNEHFIVDADLINQFVDVSKVIGWLKKDSYLPNKKRVSCLKTLDEFPSEFIRVARQPSEISFDVVAQVESKVYYWEYHEKQHASLSVSRTKHVYTPDGAPQEVPRYFQRLIRDIWRVCYFTRFTVIWKIWFETAENIDEALSFSDGFREFYSEGKFSFQNFMHEV